MERPLGRSRSSRFVAATCWRCASFVEKTREHQESPPGFIDPGDSPEQAALKEAAEEAGLRGQILSNVVNV